MDQCSGLPNTSDQKICWFCRKDRHDECMKNIPIDGKSDGPHDCTFDINLIKCECEKCN